MDIGGDVLPGADVIYLVLAAMGFVIPETFGLIPIGAGAGDLIGSRG